MAFIILCIFVHFYLLFKLKLIKYLEKNSSFAFTFITFWGHEEALIPADGALDNRLSNPCQEALPDFVSAFVSVNVCKCMCLYVPQYTGT